MKMIFVFWFFPGALERVFSSNKITFSTDTHYIYCKHF